MTQHTEKSYISKSEACEVAEKYGAFQDRDAQGDSRHEFANDVIRRHERIREAAPMLLEALTHLIGEAAAHPGRTLDNTGALILARAAIAEATGEQA